MWRILSAIIILAGIIVCCSRGKSSKSVDEFVESDTTSQNIEGNQHSISTAKNDNFVPSGILNIKADYLQELGDSVIMFNKDGSIYATIASQYDGEPTINGVGQVEIREYYPEYYVIIFTANFSAEKNEYEVEINEANKIIKHRAGITVFQSLEKHIMSSIIGGNEKNPLRIAPGGDIVTIGTEITYNDLSFEVLQMEGDWIKVKCLKDCEGCPDSGLIQGWMRWRDDRGLLVELYYVC